PAVKSYLAAALVARSGEVLGGIFFAHTDAGVFGDQHERIVAGIAAQAAVALDNASLFAEGRRTQEALERSHEQLQRANSDLELFAYSASHDLQEPLRNVAVYAEILQKHYSSA